MVLPMGSTNPAMLGGTPSCSCATSRAVGSVALLELVENAVINAARTREKNNSGDMPMSNLMIADNVMTTCASSAMSTVATKAATAIIRSNPNRDDTVKINAATPKGASSMAKWMIAVTTALSASSTSIIGFAFSAGISVSAAPNARPKKITPSMSVFAAASMGLRGTRY